jgi:hypothetical protein
MVAETRASSEPQYGEETLTRFRFKIIWDREKMSPDALENDGDEAMKGELENFSKSSSFKQNIISFERSDTENRWEWTMKMLTSKEDLDLLQHQYSKPDLGLSFEVLQ